MITRELLILMTTTKVGVIRLTTVKVMTISTLLKVSKLPSSQCPEQEQSKSDPSRVPCDTSAMHVDDSILLHTLYIRDGNR